MLAGRTLSNSDSARERAYLYRVAKGSLSEVVSLLVIAGRRGLLSQADHRQLYRKADELAAMITGAIRSTQKCP